MVNSAGKRRLIKQTQKKTAEGNSPAFTALAVIGNSDGYFGVGRGTAKESIPAKEKRCVKQKYTSCRFRGVAEAGNAAAANLIHCRLKSRENLAL